MEEKSRSASSATLQLLRPSANQVLEPIAEWKDDYDKIFVELYVEQKLLPNKPGKQSLPDCFQQRTGARFTAKQLKIHWIRMYHRWNIWCRLVQCSDMKWDPETKTFGASNEDWANYLQVDPEAWQYRLSVPLFLEKLEIMFEGRYIDGVDDEAGSSKCKTVQISKHNEDEEEAENGDDDDDVDMETMTPGLSSKWLRSTQELFVDLLLQETLKDKRPGNCYPKETWTRIVETINRNTGGKYELKQVKYRWYVMRKTWKFWCQVVAAPILKWDPNTLTFGATKEDWDIYLQENPRAAPFRKKIIRFADKQAIIFKGDIEPGKAYSRRYRQEVFHDVEPSQTPYRSRSNGVEESRLHEKVTPICTPSEAKRILASPSQSSSSNEYVYTIGECLECLDAMPEVEKGSDLYLFAMDLFLNKGNRETFLQLKTSSSRKAWLLSFRSGRA